MLIIRLPGLFGQNLKKNFIYDFINRVPFMLKESKFQELAKKEPELRKYYEIQDNGFYRLSADDKEKELLKVKFQELGFSALNFTDSRSRYQFYNLAHLWKDIQTALHAGITLWHPATEPIAVGELYEYLTGERFANELGGVPVDYDYKTVYDYEYNGANGYIAAKEQVLREIWRLVKNAVSHK